MAKISVIIPVYNTSKYLNRCLTSIINQEFKDIEIIIIDDGSTDESPSICDKIACTDKRIKAIHQKNGGVSNARNNGLSHATGDYISFIDSDDYLSTTYYKEIYDLARTNKVDICCSTAYIQNRYGHFVKPKHKDEEIILTQEEAITELLLCKKISYSLCDKLFKKSVLNNIRLDESISHNEDFLFCYEAFKSSRSIAYTSKPYYYYSYNEGSAVNSPFSKKKLAVITAQTIVYQDILVNYPGLKKLASSQYFKVVLYISSQISKSGYSDVDDLKNIKRIINNNIFIILCSNLTMGYKIDALALICGWNAHKMITSRHK